MLFACICILLQIIWQPMPNIFHLNVFRNKTLKNNFLFKKCLYYPLSRVIKIPWYQQITIQFNKDSFSGSTSSFFYVAQTKLPTDYITKLVSNSQQCSLLSLQVLELQACPIRSNYKNIWFTLRNKENNWLLSPLGSSHF